jgi:hypothetical protein
MRSTFDARSTTTTTLPFFQQSWCTNKRVSNILSSLFFITYFITYYMFLSFNNCNSRKRAFKEEGKPSPTNSSGHQNVVVHKDKKCKRGNQKKDGSKQFTQPVSLVKDLCYFYVLCYLWFRTTFSRFRPLLSAGQKIYLCYLYV